MRLFIALPVDGNARRALAQTQAELQKRGVRGRFTPPENFHITLVFLGSVPDPAPVTEAFKSVPLPRETLRFNGFTMFGDVLAAAFRPNDALNAYVHALRAALDAAGQPFDRQAFRPHITLCRKTALPAELRLVSLASGIRGVLLPVTRAQVMRSDLSGAFPVYTPLSTRYAGR